MQYANSKGADQPGHLISAFVVHCLGSIISKLSKSKLSRLYLVTVPEQAGLSHTSLQTPEDRFSCDVAQFCITK